MRYPKTTLWALALLASSASARADAPPAPVWGGPEARVASAVPEGGPVSGETLTLAPELAALPPGNSTWEVRLDVLAREVEIAPGVRYLAWTFGGAVPGPVLHVRQGDRIDFTMANRSAETVTITEPMRGASPFLTRLAAVDPQRARPGAAPMPHSMDFHAGTAAPNDKWRSIQPGESIRFEWVANYPGVFMYHCGTPPVLQHISMGQYGVVVVSPRDGYSTDDEVDREYVLVQSEFYLEPVDGGPHRLDFAAALARQPLVVAFNGHQNAHVDRPLIAEPGERVRLYLLNAGPSGTSSFHVIGTILDRVWVDGNPANELEGLQTVLLPASGGAVVELIVPEAGVYPFVDHEFADAALGAYGILRTPGSEGAAH